MTVYPQSRLRSICVYIGCLLIPYTWSGKEKTGQLSLRQVADWWCSGPAGKVPLLQARDLAWSLYCLGCNYIVGRRMVQGSYPCKRLQRILLPLGVFALNQYITKPKREHVYFEAVPCISTGTVLEDGCQEQALYLWLPGALPELSRSSHVDVSLSWELNAPRRQ